MKALPAGKQQLPLRQRVPPVTLQSHRSPFYGLTTFAEFTLKVPLELNRNLRPLWFVHTFSSPLSRLNMGRKFPRVYVFSQKSIPKSVQCLLKTD